MLTKDCKNTNFGPVHLNFFVCFMSETYCEFGRVVANLLWRFARMMQKFNLDLRLEIKSSGL